MSKTMVSLIDMQRNNILCVNHELRRAMRAFQLAENYPSRDAKRLCKAGKSHMKRAMELSTLYDLY